MSDRHRPWKSVAEKTMLSFGLIVLLLILIYRNWLLDLDQIFYDIQLQHGFRQPSDEFVIIAIDERSLSMLGRWPWSRQNHANLVDVLSEAGSRAVVFNILFSEPDLEYPQGDAALARAIERNKRVILPVLMEQEHTNGRLKETLPLPALAAASAALGHVDLELDRDGMCRSVFLRAGLDTPKWSHLALAAAELTATERLISIPGRRNPDLYQDHSDASTWKRDKHIYIPFAGPPGHMPRVSYVDVLLGNVSQELFRDKIVFIGPTASGLGGALPTPVSGHARLMPGVEITANVLDGLLHGKSIRPLSLPWQALLSIVLVAQIFLAQGFLSPRRVLLSTAFLLILSLIISVILLQWLQLWFTPAAAMLCLALSYIIWSWRRLERSVSALHEEKERVQVTLHSIGDAVLTTDENGTIDYMNPVAERLIEQKLETVMGKAMHDVLQIVNEYSGEVLYRPVTLCAERIDIVAYPEHSVLISSSGQKFAVHATVAPICSTKSDVVGMVVAISNVTEIRRLARLMAHQATHDALTQLPNRVLLVDRLEHAIAHARRGKQQVVLMLADLDRFKAVIDGLGHHAGDALLIEVAERLRPCCREQDSIARLVGDEFVVVMEGLDHDEQVSLMANNMQHALEEPFLVDGHEITITASIGISLYPKDGNNAETLLKQADTAMYRAKEMGRNHIQYYSHEMNIRSLERLVMQQQLRRAILHEEFELHYQPIVAFDNDSIVTVEALLRWRHPERGLLSPIDFIPLAEETGLIIVIGEWVIKSACELAKSWQERGAARAEDGGQSFYPSVHRSVHATNCKPYPGTD